MLYYVRFLMTGVSAVESSYVDFIDHKVLAGFFTSSDGGNYARIAMDHEMVVFNVYHDNLAGSQTRIPGYFAMLGGPAFGPNALTKIIKHYGWKTVSLYYQNAAEDVISAEIFVSIALSDGIEFGLQKRESSGTAAIEVDFTDLVSAKSNVFIFFGGALQPLGRETRQSPSSTVCVTYIGHGCFNDRATRLVQSRQQIAIICCCTLPSSRAAPCLPVSRPFGTQVGRR
jgi:hypothetical protein